MRVFFSHPFRRDYAHIPQDIQRAFDKALGLLLENPHHPSLRSKKLPGTEIWYARVTRAYRFTFIIEGDVITLRRAGTHAILKKERK